MKKLTDWMFYSEPGEYPAWYRFLTEKKEIPEGLDITFRDGRPIIAAIFVQNNGTFICGCNSNGPEVSYGELDDISVKDSDIEVTLLLMDIKLHGYGYEVIPGKKVLKNNDNY